MLTVKKNSLLILIMVGGFTGCSTSPTVPPVPTEDHSAATAEQSVEKTQVIVSPAPDESGVATQVDIDDSTTNKAIVPVSPSVIAPSKQNAAVVALLDSAQQQKRDGDLRSAQTSLQRAQRIAPRDPEVYYALANTHRDLQNYALAEQVALKGVSIVQGQPTQLHRFWTLIADIRSDAGNFSGAEKAEAMANRY